VRHELLVTALPALIQMPAELRRAAGRDRAQHPPVMWWQALRFGVIWQTDPQNFGHGVAGLGGRGARLG
jgi:hypothetical protein